MLSEGRRNNVFIEFTVFLNNLYSMNLGFFQKHVPSNLAFFQLYQMLLTYFQTSII